MKLAPWITGFVLLGSGLGHAAQAQSRFLTNQSPGQSSKSKNQTADLTPDEKRNAANGLIKRRFPALRNEVRASVQPSGLVVAQGNVPNLSDKLAVSAALLDIPGGTAVLNAITVQPPRRSDQAIQQDVERLLARDPELPDVRVRVNRQVVYFPQGSVPDLFVTDAVQKVARIPGVVDVLVGPLS
jgi:osmotically-inducible protein OsmY